MLAEPLLNYRVRGSEAVPVFLGDHDLPWLRLLIDEVARHEGRREAELVERLRRPVVAGLDLRKQRLAASVLRRALLRAPPKGLRPSLVRETVFTAAAQTGAPPGEVLRAAAELLGASVSALESALFADLPGERILRSAAALPGPLELALRSNLALAQGLVGRASLVSVSLEGGARAIVRQAHLRRLICGVRPRAGPGEPVILDVSGPYALFKHTLVYGRALGELIPLLSWCRQFRLEATCLLRGRKLVLNLGSGDPIFPAAEPRLFDSKLEARFARDFGRLTQAWDLVREPEPIVAGGTLVFPDFALVDRRQPARRWLVEIIGFWTDRYLARKLATYREAGLENLVLCIDEQLACQESDLPADARLIRFHRSIDARAVLALVEGQAWLQPFATSGPVPPSPFSAAR